MSAFTNGPEGAARARIGPNAVIQIGETLLAHGAEGLAQRIYFAAGRSEWLRRPPDSMIGEADAAAVHAGLRRLAPPCEARAYAAEAGMRTGDYILAHRIPSFARAMLGACPSRLAARLLCAAIARHAWTFAGSGQFAWTVEGAIFKLSISRNPLAVEGGCAWHEAVFAQLFRRLVHARAEVRETSCCAAGDDACRFEVHW